MENSINIVQKLNELLDADHYHRVEFRDILASLKEPFDLKIQMIDFEFYNEEKLQQAQTEKNKSIEEHDFENEAEFWELEDECLRHRNFKSEFNIDKSQFLIHPDGVFYCFFGTAKNDRSIKRDIFQK